MMRAGGASAVVDADEVPLSPAARAALAAEPSLVRPPRHRRRRLRDPGRGPARSGSMPFSRPAAQAGVAATAIGTVTEGHGPALVSPRRRGAPLRARLLQPLLSGAMIDDRIARHNARVLAAAQALGGASPPIVISLGGIVGLPSRRTRASRPCRSACSSSGSPLGTIPAAFVMRRLGRRNGYILGALLGVAGGLVAAAAGIACRQLPRCSASAPSSPASTPPSSRATASPRPIRPPRPSRRGRSPGSCAAGSPPAIIGPQTVIWTRDLVPSALFAGELPRPGRARPPDDRGRRVPAGPRRPRRHAPRSGGRPLARDRAPAPLRRPRSPPASSPTAS